MDISQLIAESGGGGIDETLNAVNSSGRLLFEQPFGDMTEWRTPSGGALRVKVIFDPFLPWSRNANLLSTCGSDFVTEDLKVRLGKYLGVIPAKPDWEKPTANELMLQHMRSSIPDRILQNDSTFQKLLEEWKTSTSDKITKQLNADRGLAQAMKTRDFRFVYHLAIDSYPQVSSGKETGRGSLGEASDKRLGVLVFVIEGKLGEPSQSAESVAKLGSGLDSESSGETLSPPPSPTNGPKPFSSLRNRQPSNSKKAQQELNRLLENLDISPDLLDASYNEWIKEAPDSATTFFEAVNSWLSTVLQRKATLLEKEEEKNSSSMYR
jgi:hypothetical protein